MAKVIEILLSIVSLGIIGFETYNLVNYFSRPGDYTCLNQTITSYKLRTNNETCTGALSCFDDVELYTDYIKLINQGDLFFSALLCFYLFLSIFLTVVEFILIFCKNKEAHIIIKCLDYIAFAVLTIFQAPLCADYGKCIYMEAGGDYIVFVSFTYGTIYNIFLIIILLGSFSSTLTGIVMGYYIYLNLQSLKYQYIANYSSVATAALISVKHFLTFLNVGIGIVDFCRKKKSQGERVVTTV